jgi:4-hydroxybenzoate polyprenyl transferase
VSIGEHKLGGAGALQPSTLGKERLRIGNTEELPVKLQRRELFLAPKPVPQLRCHGKALLPPPPPCLPLPPQKSLRFPLASPSPFSLLLFAERLCASRPPPLARRRSSSRLAFLLVHRSCFSRFLSPRRPRPCTLRLRRRGARLSLPPPKKEKKASPSAQSQTQLLRGAGCTINDLLDRNIDSQVERTRTRPIASGEISVTSALAFLAAQLSGGLAILLQLNPFAQAVGASSLPLVTTYPLAKRFTNFPQAYLGLTINWGAFFGYAAACGRCDLSVTAPLYLAGISWTLLYDTIYAHQDKDDDRKLGVGSAALALGSHPKQALSGERVLSELMLSPFALMIEYSASATLHSQRITSLSTCKTWMAQLLQLHKYQSCCCNPLHASSICADDLFSI